MSGIHQMILAAFSGAEVVPPGIDVGDIKHSLRARRGLVTWGSRTFGTPTSNLVWTYSAWIKPGQLSLLRFLLGAGSAGLVINASNQLALYGAAGTSVAVSTALVRDPTSFTHIVFNSNGTTTKAFVNNVEVLSYAGTIAPLNSAVSHNLFRSTIADHYWDGYAARICWVDGQVLTPSSFAYRNTAINEWVSKTKEQVKAVVDAGGVNSCMLDFDDGSSLVALGNDISSKNNDWTMTGFGITPGTTYDWMLDAPGNSHATLNPLRCFGGTYVPTEGSLEYANASTTWRGVVASMGLPPGKWLAEFISSNVGSGTGMTPGISPPAYNVINTGGATAIPGGAGSYSYGYTKDGVKQFNGATTSVGVTFTSNDVVGVAFDSIAGKLWFSKNGVWVEGDPSAGTTPSFSGITGEWAISLGVYNTTARVNFGQAPLITGSTYYENAGGYFRYEPPAGFKALCQANTPDPLVVNPEEHMNAVVGSGPSIKASAEALFPSNFFEWIKDRASVNDHQLIDIVRGSNNVLESNSTAAQAAYTAPVGSSVGWVWKAGGSPVVNNDGASPSMVSANVDAGFSIVTYNGLATASSFGHGLGAVPELIINKCYDTAGLLSPVWTTGFTADQFVHLHLTTAVSTQAGFQGTLPDASKFYRGTWGTVNGTGKSFVAYCFKSVPGYSKIGRYTGNANADGPFVECGFKPKFVLIRRTNGTSAWSMFDSLRSGYNVLNNALYANTTAAEISTALVDLTSTGFKLRTTDTSVNATGDYLFMAFADVPAKYASGR